MNAVIYARYSSHNQQEQSIEGQLRDCYEYANRCGYRIIGEYIDRALSGRSDDRPEFLRMIANAAKRQFQYILVWKLDRFTRNRYDSAVYRHKLKQLGVRVISAMEGISNAPESIILEAVLEASAEYYSANLSQNVRRGMRESALKGNSTGGTIPLGFKLESKKLAVDEKYAPIVRYCFEEYASGRGKQEIVAELNKKGYRTRQGNLFTINSLGRMLQNKKYTGIFHYNDTNGEILVEDACPVLIEKELFEKCATQCERSRRAPARKKAKEDYLLQGKLFCGPCGSHMVGESGRSANGNVYSYYACAARKKNHTCEKKNEPKDYLEWYICEQTVEFVLQPERINYIAERVAELYADEISDIRIKGMEKRLAAIDREFDKVFDTLMNANDRQAIIDKANARADELEAQKADIEIDLAKLRVASKIYFTTDEIRAWLKQFCKGDLFDMDFRKKIIDVFINSVYLYDDKVILYYNIEGSQQVSYIEMLESSKEPGAECSDLTDSGSPKRKRPPK